MTFLAPESAMAREGTSTDAFETPEFKSTSKGAQHLLDDTVNQHPPHRRHTEHTHTHNGTPTAYISVKKQPSDASSQVLGQINSAMDGFTLNVKPTTNSEGNVRGSGRVVRRVRSQGSDVSNSNEQIAAAIENVENLLKKYNEDHDATQLAEVARNQGIPGSLRKDVWPILLANHPCVREKHIASEWQDTSELQDESKSRETTLTSWLNRIRRELERHHRRVRNTPNTRNGSSPSNPSPTEPSPPTAAVLNNNPTVLDQLALDTAVERAIIFFLEKNTHVNYASGMVYVCLSLAEWLFVPPSATSGVSDIKVAETISSCFENMMYVMLWSPDRCSTPLEPSDSVITQRISQFLTAFRQLMPELARYFDEEEVVSFGEEWLFTWIQWWCARELGAKEKGRLWDWYLGFDHPTHVSGEACLGGDNNSMINSVASSSEIYYPWDWHILVCIALLKCCKDALEELEQSEIRTLLSRLPEINMSLIIDEAKLLRKELRGILAQEEEDYATRSNRNRKYTKAK